MFRGVYFIANTNGKRYLSDTKLSGKAVMPPKTCFMRVVHPSLNDDSIEKVKWLLVAQEPILKMITKICIKIRERVVFCVSF